MELSFGGSIFLLYICSLNKKCMDIDLFPRSNGTRTNDGYVMKFNRKPEIDHDIVEIIKTK